MQRVVTIQLAPEARLKIDGMRTIALVSCDAPRLIIRERSEAFNIHEGQSLPISGEIAEICNPYPVMIMATLAYNLPIAAPAPAARLNVLQYPKIVSTFCISVAADATKRSGAGFIMNRGAALVRFVHADSAGAARLSIFKGASANFVSSRPAGAWASTGQAKFLEGVVDKNTTINYGTYTDEDTTSWVASSGYDGSRIEYWTVSASDGRLYHLIDTETAIFMGRFPNQAIPIFAEITHLGLSTEDFD